MPEKDVTVTTAAEVTLCEARPSRVVLAIQNTDGTNFIKVSDRNGGSATGFRVFPKETRILQWIDGDKPELKRYAIADTANCVANIYWEDLDIENIKALLGQLINGGDIPDEAITSLGGSVVFALMLMTALRRR